MGVPGFFKWLSFRYPHIVDSVPRNKIDFLYLDINALFHVAIRNKATSKKPRTPRRVLSKVFKEMDIAFRACDPQVLVYIAMDGVAPRAKMNEQRSRRYCHQIFSDSNNTSSSDLGFFVPIDSVAISAGTSFMQAANDAIKYYIYQRLNGKARNLQIIFNDSSVAGEGEHKIFQFLNAQRKQPSYNRRFQHMVCGGDADFIMYALLTHEPNLRILRPGINGKDVVLNINKLRKHIIRDMVIPQLTAVIDEENIIEDFVCIINLLGNDFLPRITYLRETRADLLFKAYRDYFKESRNYITNKGGFINMKLFLRFIEFLGRILNSGSTSIGYMNSSEVAIRANDYVKTICWTLQYYSGDCPSWRFYYPHHKSPSIQDILNHVHAESFDQTFNMDTPMRPFEQLMCIVPPACHYLLPEPFRGLLVDPKSPLIEYYPGKFSCSNSKAILPFIDEKILLQAMAPRYSLLSLEDARRDNTNGRIQIYAGRESITYPTIYSLCIARGGRPFFLTNSIFGQLFYDGQMRKSVDSPIKEWRNIYHNLVVNAEYRLPNIPRNSSFDNQLKSLQLLVDIETMLLSTNKNEENPKKFSNLIGQSNENVGFLTKGLHQRDTGAQLSSGPISVNSTSQVRNYGTTSHENTSNSRNFVLNSQIPVEHLGLSKSHTNDQYRRIVDSQAQVQNWIHPDGNSGIYFANQNQTSVISNNQNVRQQQEHFNYYNFTNYDKNYYNY